MFRTSKHLRSLALGLVMASVALFAANTSLADKLYLKDGSVLDGKVTREGKDFVYFKIKVGTVQSESIYMRENILKIEKDDPTPKTDENIQKDEDAKKSDAKKDENHHTGATRMAILNFGCPSEWQGKYGDMVGVQVSADAYKKALPLLEKAKVDVVVVRVNSGGGYTLEEERFFDLFEHYYKPRFRTVAWVESAISAAAMSPWVLEEFYFFRKGNIGACTSWYGNLQAVGGAGLEEGLFKMEKASKLGKKDPVIMRSMQIMEPLSVDIDPNGEVRWRQDEDGQKVLNKKGRIFTMTASEAMETKFGRGIADTKEELAHVMGLQEVEWVALDATDLVDKSIKENDSVDKHNKTVLQKYQLAITLASQLQDKERRGIELAKARKLLAELRQMVKLNPNFVFHLGIPEEWFQEQETLIKKLASLP